MIVTFCIKRTEHGLFSVKMMEILAISFFFMSTQTVLYRRAKLHNDMFFGYYNIIGKHFFHPVYNLSYYKLFFGGYSSHLLDGDKINFVTLGHYHFRIIIISFFLNLHIDICLI